MSIDKVKITCYGTTMEWERSDAIKEFTMATRCCEGHERERYAYILSCLLCGDTSINDDNA